MFSDELLANNTIRMTADGLWTTMDLPARGRGTGRLLPAQIFIEIWGTLTYSADIYSGNPRVGLSLVLVPCYTVDDSHELSQNILKLRNIKLLVGIGLSITP